MILKPRFTRRYYQVILTRSGKQTSYLIHRLVATYFVSNPKNLPVINHKDENTANNNANNFEWCTQIYNIHYGTGLQRRIATQYKPVLCVEKGIVYPSQIEAGNQLGIGYRHITDCCNGRRHTTGGYHWKYVKEGK